MVGPVTSNTDNTPQHPTKEELMSDQDNVTTSDNTENVALKDLLDFARGVANAGYGQEATRFFNRLGVTLLNQPETFTKAAVADALNYVEHQYGSDVAREQVAKAREAFGIVVEREYNDSYKLTATVTASELRDQNWDGSQDTLVTYAQRVLEATYRYGDNGTVTVETIPDPARTA